MKKNEKTVCQIIRFRGKIEAFFVSIDEFATSSKHYMYNCIMIMFCQFSNQNADLHTQYRIHEWISVTDY